MSETINLLLKLETSTHEALVSYAAKDKRSTRNIVDTILSEWVAGRNYRPSTVTNETQRKPKVAARFVKPEGRSPRAHDHELHALGIWQTLGKTFDLKPDDAVVSVADIEASIIAAGKAERLTSPTWANLYRAVFKRYGWYEAVDRESDKPGVTFHKTNPFTL